jgi:hypothetical protein
MVIEPTVGRVVWFEPNGANFDPHGYHDIKQSLAAIVAYVWNIRLVNLSVIDQNGNHFARTSVILVQDGDLKPYGQSFCTWIPYQIGQAKKHAEDKV